MGIYSPDRRDPGKPVDVEVRPTTKPVVLVLTSYMETVWNVHRAEGAHKKKDILRAPACLGGRKNRDQQYRCADEEN